MLAAVWPRPLDGDASRLGLFVADGALFERFLKKLAADGVPLCSLANSHIVCGAENPRVAEEIAKSMRAIHTWV